MRVLVIGLLVSGCNQWYGLEKTELPPKDAPTTCPPIGTDLAFSRTVQQIMFRSCSDYSVSPTRTTAAAKCTKYIEVGTPDREDLTASTGLPVDTFVVNSASVVFHSPVIVDDARLFVGELTFGGMISYRFVDYRRDATGTWQRHSVLPFGTNSANDHIATPTLSNGVLRVMTVLATNVFQEWIEEPTGWRALPNPQDASAIGLAGAARVSLSEDGLRMLVSRSRSTVQTFYTDRASLESPFREATEIEAPPEMLMMTSDCARLYFSGLDSVFYVERR